MRNITYTISLVQNQIPTLNQITDTNINMKLSYEQFYPLNYWKHHKVTHKFDMNSLKSIMHIKHNYLLSTGESYGFTAQHMQDCPISFIQLNHVHK